MSVKDIYYSKSQHRPSMSFSVPIFAYNDLNRIIGVLVASLDLSQSLYTILLDRPGMGATGETLIVNKDVVALNELRWYENAPLKLEIKARPAILAAQGKTGIVETGDYRDKEVLAAYTYISTPGWGFVAKQDQDEIYGPIQVLLRNCLIIFCISSVVVYLVSLLVARSLSAPLAVIAAVADKQSTGDVVARNRLQRKDELGGLGNSLDRMADSLTSRMNIQREVSDVIDLVVATEGVEDFGRNVLLKLVEATSSELGSFHVLEPDGETLKVVAAVGVSKDLLEDVDTNTPSGEIAKAIELGKLQHIKDIPGDTNFHFKTFTGDILPKEIITIPLIVRGKTSAVFSLASLTGYNPDHLSIIENLRAVLATGLANLQAGDKTKKQAFTLEETNKELERQKDELERQSDELQEQNVELGVQRRQVVEANKLKSEFLSNMSHELRTPLNSIMALSKVLTMEVEEKLDPEQANYLKVIAKNGKKLLQLINDILDLSKIEAGRMDVTIKKFSIHSTVLAIAESVAVICEEKNIQLELDLPENFPLMESDENRVHQILENIISNAIKFTLKGGITVTARNDDSNFYIRVQDSGIGIAEQDLPHIFTEFRQVDGTESRSFAGTGLGLAIAHKSTRLLGGTISVESTPGHGSTFQVQLPITWQGERSEAEHIPDQELFSVPMTRGKTVLVVDDDQEAARLISSYLAEGGYNTLTAYSGREAVELAQSNDLLAITLDILMPDIDGWEVLQQLQRNPDTADIPVIMISVSDDRKTGFALGATEYLTKPVDADKLISLLSRLSLSAIRSVMLVDDNPLDRQRIKEALEKQGVAVGEASNGRECLDSLHESVPDVIVLDLMMPDMSGFEVLGRLRARPQTSHVPVIIATAKDLTGEEKDYLKKQMVPVLFKHELTLGTFQQKLQFLLQQLEMHSAGSQMDRGRRRGRKILIVEDNLETIVQVKAVLEKEGYDVSTAEGGAQALDFLSHTIPDGIILDLMMPEIDGFSVLEDIRGSRETARIPVLILTAKDLSKKDLSRLSENNIQQLVQKGDIDLEGLLFKVGLMLGNQPKVMSSSPLPSRVVKNKAPEISPEQSPAAVIQQAAEGKPVLLIIEDTPDNMLTIKAILKNKYAILEANDGEEGLKKALSYLPDLVLMDISLPGMDGFSVAAEIKKNPNSGSIPIIALTAHSMKGDRERILAAGFDDYISKPVDPEGVTSVVNSWLEDR